MISPYFIKQPPVHKSNVKDALWTAECMMNYVSYTDSVSYKNVTDKMRFNHWQRISSPPCWLQDMPRRSLSYSRGTWR